MKNINKIGNILIESGKISVEQAEKINSHQIKNGLRFGESAKQLGIINESDIKVALQMQTKFTYLEKGDTSVSEDLSAAFFAISPYLDKCRYIRNQILSSDLSGSMKVVLFTTYNHFIEADRMIANLAVLLSQLNLRILIIDTNPISNKKSIGSFFKLTSDYGIYDYLVNKDDRPNIINHSKLLNISFLNPGSESLYSPELFRERAISDMLNTLDKEFDYVIFSCDPLSHSPLLQMLAPFSHFIYCLFKKNLTTLSQSEELKLALNLFDDRINSAVIL